MTKKDILDQINRVASESGGVAPGTHKFYKETGCKKYDWYGKYWVRWSDAIKEAGLTPNQMREGYEEEFLIEKLVNLAQEIGHFPVEGELRMKGLEDKTFPSRRTFADRLGSKNQTVAKVIEYCRMRSSHEGVIRMCEAILPKSEVDKAREEELGPEAKSGVVYLIKSGRYYKIGKTNAIGRREYDLAIQLAEKPTTIHVIKTDDPDGIETYWHRRFAAKRKNGEWFDLSPNDIKAFKKWIRIV